MKLTKNQLLSFLSDDTAKQELFDATGIDQSKLVIALSSSQPFETELSRGVLYVLKNYFDTILTYEAQFEIYPNPIHIYGFKDIFVVELIDEEGGYFFDTSQAAEKYADKAMKEFYTEDDI